MLWLPDIMIWNLENVDMRYFMNRNREIYLFPNNILSLWTDMVLEFYCPMVFDNYPIDTHDCELYFRSNSYNATYVNLTMEGLEINEGVNLLDYSYDVSSAQRLFLRNHSEIGVNIKFQRNLYKYIVNYYIPSGLLVSISWVNNHYRSIILADDQALYYYISDKFCYPPRCSSWSNRSPNYYILSTY